MQSNEIGTLIQSLASNADAWTFFTYVGACCMAFGTAAICLSLLAWVGNRSGRSKQQ